MFFVAIHTSRGFLFGTFCALVFLICSLSFVPYVSAQTCLDGDGDGYGLNSDASCPNLSLLIQLQWRAPLETEPAMMERTMTVMVLQMELMYLTAATQT
jgi:hypothetical protein